MEGCFCNFLNLFLGPGQSNFRIINYAKLLKWIFPVKHISLGQLVDNKVKGQISKSVLQENKASQIFRKKNICVRIGG